MDEDTLTKSSNEEEDVSKIRVRSKTRRSFDWLLWMDRQSLLAHIIAGFVLAVVLGSFVSQAQKVIVNIDGQWR